MTAELLREAAKVLRQDVAELPERFRCEWEQDSSEIYAVLTRDWVGEALHEEGAEVAYYMVRLHPPVALALADWLERMVLLMVAPPLEYMRKVGRGNAATWVPEFPDHRVLDPAFALARAILRRSE